MPRLLPTTFCIHLRQRVALPNPIWIGLEKFVSKFSPIASLPKCLSKNIFTYTANFQDVVRYGAMTVLGLNEAE